MRFADVIGQDDIAARLREGVRQGRVPHAQLFTGLNGYGALPLALAYAQYIGCERRTDDDSCGECPSCVQMSQLAHPDLHMVMPVNRQGKKGGEAMLSRDFMALFREVMAHSGGYLSADRWFEALDLGKTLKGAISADEADEIIKQLSLKSYSGGYKTVIIWMPEMMNEQAANKLLKILEEPWPQTLFVMVSEAPERLLATILSRTQQLAVPQISLTALEGYAKSHSAHDAQQIGRMARLAAGDLNSLKSLMSGEADGKRREFFELFSQLMRFCYTDKHLELLTWAEEVAQLTRSDQQALLRYSLMMLREAYIRHAGLESLCYTWGEEANFCTKFAPYIGNQNIEPLIKETETALAQLAQNANATILFTHYALTVSKMINRL